MSHLTEKKFNIHPQHGKACRKTISLVFSLYHCFLGGMKIKSDTKIELHGVLQQNAGRPNSCGSNSSMLLSRSVASWVRPGFRLSSGIITTCIPAASAAFTPLGASSNTKHWARIEEMETKWYYPISLFGLQDFTSADATELRRKTNTRKWETGAPFPFSDWWTWYSSGSTIYLCKVEYPFNLQFEEQCPLQPHFIGFVYIFSHCIEDDLISITARAL